MVKNTDGLEKITVLFKYKKKAHDLGAIFGEDRCWYIPEGISEENKVLLHFLGSDEIPKTAKEEDNKEDIEIGMNPPIIEEDTEINVEDSTDITETEEQAENNAVSKVSNVAIDYDGFDFNKILEFNDTLATAYAIKKHGLPDDPDMCTKILNNLRKRTPGQYPIDYQGMLQCSPAFEKKYNEEYVTRLIQENINNTGRIEEMVTYANITEEEKALLLLVLPV